MKVEQQARKHETIPAFLASRKMQIKTTISYPGLAKLERLTTQVSRNGEQQEPSRLARGAGSCPKAVAHRCIHRHPQDCG